VESKQKHTGCYLARASTRGKNFLKKRVPCPGARKLKPLPESARACSSVCSLSSPAGARPRALLQTVAPGRAPTRLGGLQHATELLGPGSLQDDVRLFISQLQACPLEAQLEGTGRKASSGCRMRSRGRRRLVVLHRWMRACFSRQAICPRGVARERCLFLLFLAYYDSLPVLPIFSQERDLREEDTARPASGDGRCLPASVTRSRPSTLS